MQPPWLRIVEKITLLFAYVNVILIGMKKTRFYIWIGSAIAIVAVAWYAWHGAATTMVVPGIEVSHNQTTAKPIASVVYRCDGGKTFSADFYNGPTIAPTAPDEPPHPGGFAVIVSDTKMTLQQTLSADGARYANADESTIFWSKGNGALFTEKGLPASTYQDCVVVQ
jgi:membrane-bound inhibitor of C-type lysozyme